MTSLGLARARPAEDGLRASLVGVYLCRGDAEVVDLVRCGQAVIGLALGRVTTEAAAGVTHLPADLVGAEAQRRPRLQVVS